MTDPREGLEDLAIPRKLRVLRGESFLMFPGRKDAEGKVLIVWESGKREYRNYTEMRNLSVSLAFASKLAKNLLESTRGKELVNPWPCHLITMMQWVSRLAATRRGPQLTSIPIIRREGMWRWVQWGPLGELRGVHPFLDSIHRILASYINTRRVRAQKPEQKRKPVSVIRANIYVTPIKFYQLSLRYLRAADVPVGYGSDERTRAAIYRTKFLDREHDVELCHQGLRTFGIPTNRDLWIRLSVPSNQQYPTRQKEWEREQGNHRKQASSDLPSGDEAFSR